MDCEEEGRERDDASGAARRGESLGTKIEMPSIVPMVGQSGYSGTDRHAGDQVRRKFHHSTRFLPKCRRS